MYFLLSLMIIEVTRSLVIVSKCTKELECSTRCLAIFLNVVIINLIIFAPRSNYPTLVPNPSWSFISETDCSKVKSKVVALLNFSRVVLFCPLKALSFLFRCEWRFLLRFVL
jgi:hypothetical protein